MLRETWGLPIRRSHEGKAQTVCFWQRAAFRGPSSSDIVGPIKDQLIRLISRNLTPSQGTICDFLAL